MPRPLSGFSWRKAARWALFAVAGFLAFSLLWVGLYRFVDPPGTPLMLIRAASQGLPAERDWVPLDTLPAGLVEAVIGAEDSRFCEHGGVDWDAVGAALEANEEGRRLRGGSTISQQTAKNAFLWPDRTWARKGLELWFTTLVETFWPKRRIMEVYLNVIEWAPGVYGAEAASRHWFGKPAAQLTRREAALLAAIIPSPLRWRANPPGPYVAGRARVLEQRMGIVRRDGLADCV
ncbi:monofunctional biosynthetic peptidoglycan transglycosylase [Aerophototrophica crusticola]|uniref:Biosynthetic peptidoglycan transglycosylase n=2 Tax=Aerophototrophica crusticola TaxID=1709002 RepID=A0A858RBR7_9PROT|nr:monofunctional biosynthetic peptidoglycan transglycosylase [Rhodospirillaceae bacterium B3]